MIQVGMMAASQSLSFEPGRGQGFHSDKSIARDKKILWQHRARRKSK
jgi:hypothetical protein